jgi:hypothetical protein
MHSFPAVNVLFRMPDASSIREGGTTITTLMKHSRGDIVPTRRRRRRRARTVGGLGGAAVQVASLLLLILLGAVPPFPPLMMLYPNGSCAPPSSFGGGVVFVMGQYDLDSRCEADGMPLAILSRDPRTGEFSLVKRITDPAEIDAVDLTKGQVRRLTTADVIAASIVTSWDSNGGAVVVEEEEEDWAGEGQHHHPSSFLYHGENRHNYLRSESAGGVAATSGGRRRIEEEVDVVPGLLISGSAAGGGGEADDGLRRGRRLLDERDPAVGNGSNNVTDLSTSTNGTTADVAAGAELFFAWECSCYEGTDVETVYCPMTIYSCFRPFRRSSVKVPICKNSPENYGRYKQVWTFFWLSVTLVPMAIFTSSTGRNCLGGCLNSIYPKWNDPVPLRPPACADHGAKGLAESAAATTTTTTNGGSGWCRR